MSCINYNAVFSAPRPPTEYEIRVHKLLEDRFKERAKLMGWAEDNGYDCVDPLDYCGDDQGYKTLYSSWKKLLGPQVWYPNKQSNVAKQIMNTPQVSTTAKSLLAPERTYVAGVSYSDYQRVKQFKIGTELGLIWERSNKVDKKAIAVYYKGTKIGYIPAPRRSHNTGEIELGIQSRMHNLRECGFRTKAILTQYRPNAAKAWEIFTIEIQFSDPNKVAGKSDPIDVKF